MIVAGKYIRAQKPVGSIAVRGHTPVRLSHSAPAALNMPPRTTTFAITTTPDGKRKLEQEFPSTSHPTGPYKRRRRSLDTIVDSLAPTRTKDTSECRVPACVPNRGPISILQRSPSSKGDSKTNGGSTGGVKTRLLASEGSDSECCGVDLETNTQKEVQDDLLAWLTGALKARMDDDLIVHLILQHFHVQEVFQARNILMSMGFSLSLMKGGRGLLHEILVAIRGAHDPNNNNNGNVQKLPRFVPRDVDNRPCVRPVPSGCVIQDLEALISSVVKLTTRLCWQLPEARHYSKAMEQSGTGSLARQLSGASEALARLKTIIDWEIRTTRTISMPMHPSSDPRGPTYGIPPVSECHKINWSNTFPPCGAVNHTGQFLYPVKDIPGEVIPGSSPTRLFPPGVSPSSRTPPPTKLIPPGVTPSPPGRVRALPLCLSSTEGLSAHLSPVAPPPLSPALNLPSPRRTNISPRPRLQSTSRLYKLHDYLCDTLLLPTTPLPGTPTSPLYSPVALNSPTLDIKFGEITDNCLSHRTRKIKAPLNVNAAEFKLNEMYYSHFDFPIPALDSLFASGVNPLDFKDLLASGVNPFYTPKAASDNEITTPHPPQRPWIPVGQPDRTKPSCIFTVLCYNVLCDKYATRQMYGYCPSWALEWEYRKKGIMDEVRNLCADIITLQEVETDQFYNFFLPELKADGYDGIFSPKSRAKHMAENERKFVDGCAVFWRTTKFSLVKDHLVEFNKLAMANHDGSEDMLNRVMTKDNIGLAALLETREAAWENSSVLPNKNQINQPVLVCTAHVHWDPEFCDVKLIQTIMLMSEVKAIMPKILEEARQSRPSLKIDAQNIHFLLCGDLNSLPESGVIEFLTKSCVSMDHEDFKGLEYKSSLLKWAPSRQSNTIGQNGQHIGYYTHAFKITTAIDFSIMPYTNYTYDFKGIIDYIFHSVDNMNCLGVLGPIEPDWFRENRIQGCPHPHIPSDHFPLLVQLELKIHGQNSSSNSNTSNNSSNSNSGNSQPNGLLHR